MKGQKNVNLVNHNIKIKILLKLKEMHGLDMFGNHVMKWVYQTRLNNYLLFI